MRGLWRRVFTAEVIAALRLQALGAWWAGRALARLGKLSGVRSGRGGGGAG